MKNTLELQLGNGGIWQEVFSLPNDFAPTSDYVQVVPYGDYPHSGPLGLDGKPLKRDGKLVFPKGVVQRIDNEAGRVLVDELNAAKLKPNFVGRPWYIGHHDIDPIKYPDPNSYGWFKDLANRADGVYAKVEWTPDGSELIDKKKFKLFSPLFGRAEITGQKSADGKAIIRPTQLKSMAFTNNPNMDVMPLANTAQLGASTGDLAEMMIENAVSNGILQKSDRATWLQNFEEDERGALLVLANAGTREGALKGWEARRGAMAGKKGIAAKVVAKNAKPKLTGKKKREADGTVTHEVVDSKGNVSHVSASLAAKLKRSSPGAAKEEASPASAPVAARVAAARPGLKIQLPPKPSPEAPPTQKATMPAAARVAAKPSLFGRLRSAFGK